MTTTEPPDAFTNATPTKSQQAAALTHANQVRTARARLRGQLRQRKHDAPAVLANLLINPPSYMTTCRSATCSPGCPAGASEPSRRCPAATASTRWLRSRASARPAPGAWRFSPPASAAS